MLILVGPSASGKTEIVKALIKNHHMEKLVTYTTREKRVGEINHVDYHFINVVDFEQKIKENFFIEYVKYNYNYYGTSRADLSANKVVILEPSGLKHYLLGGADCKVCFLSCPKEVRAKRMRARGDLAHVIEERLHQDELIFTEEIAKLADWIIPGDGATVSEIAEYLYNLYQKSIEV